MPLYTVGFQTQNLSANAAIFEIRTQAVDRCLVKEIGFTTKSAASGVAYCLGRPGNIGITPLVTYSFLADDPAEIIPPIVVATAWSTPPTVPSTFFRRITMGATGGMGMVWIFPKGLMIPASGSLVLWNNTGLASAMLSCWIKINE